MSKFIILTFCLLSTVYSFSQFDMPAAATNPRAMVSEEVGITSITIKYSRPDVSGREGKIWGSLITPGFSVNNFVTNKNSSPWRAGANENTTISFEHDVKIEGHPIKAGTYALFIAYGADSSTLIFNSETESWGSFYYDPGKDVLKVNVHPMTLDHSVEFLKYEFIDHKEKSCTIALEWEKLAIPFKVEVDVENIVIARLRDQVTSRAGFNQLNLVQAAQYCLNKNINLDEALAWSQRAAGLKSYNTLSNLATAYTKLNKMNQADSVMNEALNYANDNQYQQYARNLIGAKRADRALTVVQGALSKFSNSIPMLQALAYAFSAKGDYPKAMDAVSKAMALATTDNAKKSLQDMMDKLKGGKDIN